MSYILVIWTIVGYAGTQMATHEKYGWQPIGEFHHEDGTYQRKNAKEMCEEAARQLGYTDSKNYRCLRSK